MEDKSTNKLAQGQPPHDEGGTSVAIARFDKFIFLIAIINPLMTLPQAIKIWTSRSAVDVSLTTWVAYSMCAICWLIYSAIHKEKALFINNVIWLILEIVVISGILVHS